MYTVYYVYIYIIYIYNILLLLSLSLLLSLLLLLILLLYIYGIVSYGWLWNLPIKIHQIHGMEFEGLTYPDVTSAAALLCMENHLTK